MLKEKEPENDRATSATPTAPAPVSRGYANYVLGVLVLVYVFNFIDRQILSILNEHIRADLGVTDAQMGFLFGTAFAVFYAIFGIPLGRLADTWVRKNLISIGLSFWSLMTALSGTARSFGSLAVFRIGVGVGESSASPAAFSMLGDYFPPRLRATAVAIYSSGVYIGAGIGMLIGGQIVDRWNRAFPGGEGAPFGLVGWHAAFFAVGLPGLLMALWVFTLREPVRGQSEGLTSTAVQPSPFAVFFRELAAVLPPLTIVSLALAGIGARGLALNLGIAGALALGAWGLYAWLGSALQWIALSIGLYAFFSWVQGLQLRDRATFEMIFKCKAIVLGMIGYAWCAFVGYGIGYFAAPFFQRYHHETTARAGTILGITAAFGGLIGVSLGGYLSDRLKERNPRARPYLGIASAALSIPIALALVSVPSVNVAYGISFFYNMLSSFWIGSAVALVNELVVPRMRATASAYYILAVTFIGLALGPYTMGRISTGLEAGGMDAAMALRTAMSAGLSVYVLAIFFLWLASRTVEHEEKGRLERARAVGEPV